MRDESEKEVVHRLEAFSDVVIGFGLAQLSLTLVMPLHGARDLFAHVKGVTELVGFVVTFLLVCAIWWSHHRLFRHLFVPVTPNIIANFAALGGVIFLSYSMQVLVHFGMHDTIAYAMYSGSYAWISLLFSAIAWNGLRLRGEKMPADVRAQSMKFAVRTTIVAVWLAGITVATLFFGSGSAPVLWLTMGFVLSVVVHRILTRRAAVSSSPSA